jgi:hypothetical protein
MNVSNIHKGISKGEYLSEIGWQSTNEDASPWITIRFRDSMTITGVILKGMDNVKEYSITTTQDLEKFEFLVDSAEVPDLANEISATFAKSTNVLAVRITVRQKFFVNKPAGFHIQIMGCVPKCVAPLISTQCANCQKTCFQQKKCTKECIPGCTCPENMVWHDGKCIPPPECPCYYREKLLEIGARIFIGDCKEILCSPSGLTEIVKEDCRVCEKGMVECACACCHKTCDHRRRSVNCDIATCKSGCCCPDGTYFSAKLDRCVPSCPCISGNRTYEIGQTWQEECRKCTCTPDKGAECLEDGCHITKCPPMHRLVNKDPKDGKCCKCIPIVPTCQVDGKEYTIGQRWAVDACHYFVCELVVTESESKCSKQSDCGCGVKQVAQIRKVETICPQQECGCGMKLVAKSGHCCPVCEMNYNTTTGSQVQLVQLTDTTTSKQSPCQLVSISKQNVTVSVNGTECVSQNPVEIQNCIPQSSINLRSGEIIGCTCCKPVGRQINKTFVCGAKTTQIPIYEVTSCTCESGSGR